MTATSERDFAIEIVQRLHSAGFEALWAGGCVRDSLLGREPGDFDVATSARPDDVRQLFRRTLNVGAAFGVMIVLGNRQQGQVEVATFRADGDYLDGRRPRDVQFCSAEQDALRRDFTINGIFYDPLQDRVIDYVSGQEDLRAGVVRAIGDPQARFSEDKLRLLRAVRFAATLGFALEPDTAAGISQMASQIGVVSAERIAQELRKMLTLPNRSVAVALMMDTGLLAEIVPELELNNDENRRKARHTLDHLPPDASFELAAAALFQSLSPSVAANITRRLRLANRESDEIVWYLSNQHALQSAAGLPAATLKRVLAHANAPGLIDLIQARDDATDEADAEFCRGVLETTPRAILNPEPLLAGADLIAAGFQPGPAFKPLLDSVRDAQLNEEVTTREQALELAKRLAKESSRPNRGD